MAETVEWVEPDGTATPLTAVNGVQIEPGVAGRFAPPVTLTESPLPSGYGSRLRSVRHPPRELAFPIAFLADNEAGLLALERAWVQRFAPDRGDGRLRVTDHAGGRREIICRYNGGLEVVETGEHVGGAQHVVAVFRASDPFWQDVDDIVEVFALTASSVSFFPIPNGTSGSFVSLAQSTIASNPLVVNDGDIEAWPVWELLGPTAGQILFENQSTGKQLELDQTVSAGDRIVIDTRPGFKTVALDDGTNLYPDLTAASSLWPLQPGGNELNIVVDGATVETQAVLTFRRRWRTA